ncbi:polyamine aminopropyltransferase [Echria macrotheca]|uniref:Polyamine aminopropyltransferase n=1 Tax=Echria macrotheca TaxID=438768 RepID=A0AAJ0BKC5_9PEZI|nr:polyamine aminopropyltransferase [Echria macrotheca]
MAPSKASKTKAGKKETAATNKPPPFIDPTTSFTPESFERELQELASKAKSETWPKFVAAQAKVYANSLALLVLLALSCNASQQALSPVYGAIPAAQHHAKLVAAACFAGWSSNLFLGRALPFKPVLLLPVLALYLPATQFFLTRFSETLTASWGPLVTESLTLFPLVALSAACVATFLDGADLTALPSWLGDALPGIGSYGVFKGVETWSSGVLGEYAGRTVLNTRVGLELVLGASYALLAPSKLLLLTLPALLHTAVLDTRVPTVGALQRLNGTLASEGWIIWDRKESVTGYVSVVESVKDGFRLMRCDHSLLGGEWVKFIGQGQFKGNQVAEPVYGVFAMLEAVRLVKMPKPIVDSKAKALVIGLGVGTTPGALVAHGIDTTVVEIDPAVHEFALKYFHLPKNHTAIIQDAVSYTDSLAAQTRSGEFDYIIHDVFTGGAEPIPLFTLEFLQNLHTLLKPGGVIAINYAGDFTLPPPRVVVKTIRHVFPTCRIFREHPRDDDSVARHATDFANMVIFCTKLPPSQNHQITFRDPTPRDLLNSPSRDAFLMPRHEVTDADFASSATEKDEGLLTRNDTAKLEKWHGRSALGHWSVMRTVLPPVVWENW